MFNNIIFPLTSGTIFSSHELETLLPSQSYVIKLNPSGSFLIAEALILFAADACVLLPFVEKQTTLSTNPDSQQLMF